MCCVVGLVWFGLVWLLCVGRVVLRVVCCCFIVVCLVVDVCCYVVCLVCGVCGVWWC